jgi:hypothetical protein
MTLLICKHCQRPAYFYPGIRGRCAACWRAEMRAQRQCKGFVYNENARAKRTQRKAD